MLVVSKKNVATTRVPTWLCKIGEKEHSRKKEFFAPFANVCTPDATVKEKKQAKEDFIRIIIVLFIKDTDSHTHTIMRLLAKAPELVPLFGFVGFASVYAMLHACRKTRQALQKQHDVLPYIKSVPRSDFKLNEWMSERPY